MNKVEIYNSDYTKLNHAYILIFESYQKLVQCEDADRDVLFVMENILRAFNPALDRIKSEMTVQTRFKEDPEEVQQKNESTNKNPATDNKTFIKAEKSGFVVGSIPVYTGDDESGEDPGKDFCNGQVTMANQKTSDETNSKKKGFFGSGRFFGKKRED